MKEIIIEQVRWQILSRLDQDRKKPRLKYDGRYTENVYSDDYLEEDVFTYHDNDIPLSPVINIFIEAENLFLIEVFVENAFVDHFCFSIKKGKLIFDLDREIPTPECDNYTDVLNIEDDNPDTECSGRNSSYETNTKPIFVPFIQFSIDESEFRTFEQNSNMYLRKWKLQKLNQNW